MKKTRIILLVACGLLLSGCNILSGNTDNPQDQPGGEDKPGGEDTPGGDQPGGDQPGGDQPGGDTPGGETDLTPEYEKGEKKDVNGTGLMFFETVGFNTKDASVFEVNGERYVIYAGQEEAKGDQVFAARKGTLVDGKWVYGEKHIILKGAEDEDAWDQYIAQPSVVKGEFALQDEMYNYIMAYQGNEDGSNYNYHIGLAVAKDVFGPWVRVGDEPLIENPEIYESSYGFGSPVLVNCNEEGVLSLSYSFGETQLSGERHRMIDASDLTDIYVEPGYTEIPTAGLVGRDDGIITNAGVAVSSNGTIYVANDGMTSRNAPGNATSFEVAVGGADILGSATAEWRSIKKVTGMDTIDLDDPDSLGWDELCSPAFVTDEYGMVADDATKLNIVYTVFNEGVMDAKYTGQLCEIEVALND